MFKTIINYVPTNGKVMDSVSETIPDQALSARTILAKFVRHEPIHASALTPHYFGEDQFIPNPQSMDLTELQEFKERNAEAYADAQRKHKAPAKQAEGAVEEATIVDDKEQVEPAEH